jgi:hypothetical protein
VFTFANPLAPTALPSVKIDAKFLLKKVLGNNE